MSQPSFEPDTGFGMDSTMADPAAPGGEMPIVASTPQYRKQGFSIYTVMLILSFVFLLTSMIVLFVEAGKY